MENDNKFLDSNKTKKSKTTPKNKNEQNINLAEYTICTIQIIIIQ